MLQITRDDLKLDVGFSSWGAQPVGEPCTDVHISGEATSDEQSSLSQMWGFPVLDAEGRYVAIRLNGQCECAIDGTDFPMALSPTEPGDFRWEVQLGRRDDALLGYGSEQSIDAAIDAINSWLSANWDSVEFTASKDVSASSYDFQGDDTVYFDYSPDAEFVSAWYEHDEDNNFSGEERYDLIFNYDNEWVFSGSSDYHSVVRAEQDMNLMLRGLAEDISIIQPETPEDFEDIAVKYGLARDF